MPTQYGEDKVILEYFGAGSGRFLGAGSGRFLDIGAFDGVTFSNTRCLAERGWSGVCVEPSPPAFCWLMKNSTNYPLVELVNAAVVPEGGRLLAFNVNSSDAYAADMLSTLSPEHKARFPDHPWRTIRIAGVTWEELFDACPPPYDFVNIDVEGTNELLLDSLPFERSGARMISLEIDPEARRAAMQETLTRAGYAKQTAVGGNLLAWK